MKTDRELLQMAMDALLNRYGSTGSYLATEAIIAIRKALARPEQGSADKHIVAQQLAEIASKNPEALPLAMQLLGVAPCTDCGYVKEHCRCAKQEAARPEPEPVKDHEIAELVNRLRAIAMEFHDTQQLRDRIAREVVPMMKRIPQPAEREPVAAPASAASPLTEQDALDAARYRWLRDESEPPHNFYISVPVEFHGIRYKPHEVDASIDAALASQTKQGGAE